MSAKDAAEIPNVDSPVGRAFSEYKNLLDSKHDKHEALVKLSRDITIESKRIIFHLHRCIGGDKETLLADAEKLITHCLNVHLYNMAKELEGADHYIYTRAITAGLQEFIEALTFYSYLTESSLPFIDAVRDRLQFDDQSLQTVTQETSAELTEVDGGVDLPNTTVQQLSVPLSQSDYILGIADLTGELMRMAINSIGWGDMDTPAELCLALQHLDMAYKTYCSTARGEMNRKMLTLKQSVSKVENACYTVKLRGSEIPKHMLVHSIQINTKAGPERDIAATEYDHY